MIRFGKREKSETPENSEKLEKSEERYKSKRQKKHDISSYDDLRDKGRISARIIDVSSGLKAIEGVYAVRIHSTGFTALIMNDYIPALGKIDGDVTFLSRDGEYPYLNIHGFYKHQHNEFTLLVEEHVNAGKEGRNAKTSSAEETAAAAKADVKEVIDNNEEETGEENLEEAAEDNLEENAEDASKVNDAG